MYLIYFIFNILPESSMVTNANPLDLPEPLSTNNVQPETLPNVSKYDLISPLYWMVIMLSLTFKG